MGPSSADASSHLHNNLLVNGYVLPFVAGVNLQKDELQSASANIEQKILHKTWMDCKINEESRHPKIARVPGQDYLFSKLVTYTSDDVHPVYGS